MFQRRTSPFPIFLVILLAGLVIAQACQVPVFRYALERWEPARYRVTITPGKDGLTEMEKKALEVVRTASEDSALPANVEIEEEPSAATSGEARLVLRYPESRRNSLEEPIWVAPLTMENAKRVAESPIRSELRRRLLAGESAIWVLLESGDAAKDAAAEKVIKAAMAEAQSSLILPEPEAAASAAATRSRAQAKDDAEILRADLPMEIRFSLLRLRRDDAAEAALVAMLTHLENDLGEYAGEPMVFPVFGRGRALEPLIGAGITVDNAMEQAAYLCGACSCEVKDQNPGMDLLMAADWDPVDTTPELEIVNISPEAKAEPSAGPNAFPSTFTLAALGGLIAGALGVVMLRRQAKS